ncbi:hypothetical protein HYC85_001282 [Camellia sinensis]|uniref:Matrin-type domain-containing protein n=1 Tax=Camellia sinensis TaxID=4442 RepID=A0A7J7I4Z7_CAMSI|nr:hypothetical protein HYC85_001282 [Camellia sinensis]
MLNTLFDRSMLNKGILFDGSMLNKGILFDRNMLNKDMLFDGSMLNKAILFDRSRRIEERGSKMDREWGSKPGSGGAASAQNEAIDRRERLRRLALETIDIAKDPYFMRNHLGSYECKLCLTLHNNEGNYLAHTQGKRHQTNLAKRAAREAKEAPALPQPHKRKVTLKKSVKIGRPGYRVTKQFDPETKQRSLLFQIEYPEIEDNTKPRHRFMSSFEQRVQSFDKRYQYLLFAAEPYEIISFKVPSTEIDKSTPKFFSHWDPDSKMFTVSLYTHLCSLSLSLSLNFDGNLDLIPLQEITVLPTKILVAKGRIFSC